MRSLEEIIRLATVYLSSGMFREPTSGTEILYYNTIHDDFHHWNRVEHRSYKHIDIDVRMKQLAASFQRFGPKQEKVIKEILKYAEKELEHILILEVSPDKNITAIKRFDRLFVKYYLETLCFERSGHRLSIEDLFKFCNIFDKVMDDKYICILKAGLKQNAGKELKDFLEDQGIDNLFLRNDLVLFANPNDYHLFCLLYKDKLVINCAFPEFRNIVLASLGDNIDKALKDQLIYMYVNVNLLRQNNEKEI